MKTPLRISKGKDIKVVLKRNRQICQLMTFLPFLPLCKAQSLPLQAKPLTRKMMMIEEEEGQVQEDDVEEEEVG